MVPNLAIDKAVSGVMHEVTENDMLYAFTLLYGKANSGKSRLATSLTERYGQIAYCAIDRGSETLGSVMEQHRSRIRRFTFDMKDPFVTAAAIALTDWKGKYGCDTLVIDTYTTLVWKQLLYGSRKGIFNTESAPMGVGIPGTASFSVIPSPRDYGGVQGAVSSFLSMLEENQKETHVIVVCHETLKESKLGGSVGGPRLAGKALTDWFPGQFTVTARLDRKFTPKKNPSGRGMVQVSNHVARLADHGVWIAGFKENDPRGCQLKEIELNEDPVNFWEELDAVSASVFNKEEK